MYINYNLKTPKNHKGLYNKGKKKNKPLFSNYVRTIWKQICKQAFKKRPRPNLAFYNSIGAARRISELDKPVTQLSAIAVAPPLFKFKRSNGNNATG